MRTKTLPLRDQFGRVHSHAIVDTEDYLKVASHRWHLTGRKIPGHVARHGADGRRVYLHHEVMGSRELLDHVNRNRLDNRKDNLRPATTAQNAQNQDSRGGRSKYRGVVWDKPREMWRAQVMIDGKYHNLGRFHDEDEAGQAAADFRARHMPFSEDAALASFELAVAA